VAKGFGELGKAAHKGAADTENVDMHSAHYHCCEMV
jgi:hypothetical protein